MPRRSRLDKLVELAVVQGQLHAGAPSKTLQARVKLPVSVLANADAGRTPGKALKWTQAEDEFLTRNLAYLSEAEIAQHLGRTVVAVHLRWKRDLRLTPLTKLSDCITTQKAAETLGVDPKAAMRWVDMGLLPGRRLPMRRVVRSIRRSDFRAWVLDPSHWIHFNPQRVRDPELRRMLHLRKKRWGDEWLTVGQAARLHGVCIAVINNALHEGRLTGVKWGNWHLLRSEVTRPGLRFFNGKGGRGVPKVEWSERADTFLVLAAALGHSPDTIARLMGGERSRLAWTGKRVAYRLVTLRRTGRIPRLIREHDLAVSYERGRLFADWKDYRRRFPALARAMTRLKSGQDLDGPDLALVRRSLAAWAAWHGQATIARSLTSSALKHVGLAFSTLRKRGIDPFARRD